MKKKYDWIVIGGGISGISVSEILIREGKSVLLIEKNDKLASETSKVFHEWMHSGALYSLVPDNLLTLRYLLGATDDLLEFYKGFLRMNLIPTESGIQISKEGWFNNHRIEYRYRIHKLNPVWLSITSRSMNLIDKVSSHDWLRKRAGSDYSSSNFAVTQWVNNIPSLIASKKMFYPKLSPDLTMNSRHLISDLLSLSIQNGLEILTEEAVIDVNDSEGNVWVTTTNDRYNSEKVVICSPDVVSQLKGIPIKKGYAPIAIVENLPEEENSFVELDYSPRKCINLLIKENGIGQVGGITLNNKKDVQPYLNYIISKHKKRNPSIKVIGSYVGLKKELVQKGEDRNYLYHINHSSSNVWTVILGKFTLAFSMAPEFYRRVYHKNPTKKIDSFMPSDNKNLLSETSWQEIINNRE